MDILGFFGDVLSNPVGLIGGIVGGAVGIVLLVPALDILFFILDEIIFFVDDKIIDKIPFKPAKDNFQKALIKRLKKRRSRYSYIIKRISD
jgi:hypothetical protein